MNLSTLSVRARAVCWGRRQKRIVAGGGRSRTAHALTCGDVGRIGIVADRAIVGLRLRHPAVMGAHIAALQAEDNRPRLTNLYPQ